MMTSEEKAALDAFKAKKGKTKAKAATKHKLPAAEKRALDIAMGLAGSTSYVSKSPHKLVLGALK